MIQKLPPEVVNQIAAGEVVERPASVVKELVENALDAGASQIRVEIQQGGAQLIRVLDDGEGFRPEDLPLAFASHATSKLRSVDDLDHIGSLGFRGEALASIGSVSHARIRSRRHDSDVGYEVSRSGGQETPPQPCGCPCGTQIDVRDLFFNVPARRRFLKSAAAEKAKIQELLIELSLSRLEVAFTLCADDREVLRLPVGDDLGARFGRCFGPDLARGLLPVDRAFGDLRVSGLIAEPDLARRDSRLELLYVNGRRARESSAVHAIRQAYRDFLMGGRIPVYVLQLSLPAAAVDVNVHPRKAEVRFVDARRVAGCLHSAVSSALQARGQSTAPGGIAVDDDKPRARSGFPDLPADLFGRPTAAPTLWTRDPSPPPVVRDAVVAPVAGAGVAAGAAAKESAPLAPGASQPAAVANPFARVSGRYLQVLDLYLLLETPDGLLVVDQHALHERVVYEQLQRQHAQRAVQVQRLLTPAVVDVLPGDRAWLLAAAPALGAAGLLVEEFGPASIAVQGIPVVLAKVPPAKLLQALVAHGGDEALPALTEQIRERFHSMACRAAVMSGDRLSDSEIQELLQSAAKLEHPHNCPHGRPTVLTFSRPELERYFRRRC